jgi:hypothetical protein
MTTTLSDQQLEALRPLATVIEGAIKDTPIRLGTDDWGTMLAAGILMRVAAYMGGVVPTTTEAADWLLRGTRDLSNPEHPAGDEDVARSVRRRTLPVLLDRAQHGVLTADEADLLRQHVNAEIRQADTARRDA